MNLKFLFFAFLLFSAQNLFAQTECQPPQIIFNKDSGNIFNEQQEMDLGDAMFERLQKDYRVIDDETVNAYLQSIGDRISRHLPQTNLKFRFVVVDLPDTNAYAMAGGRIFVTRKLISFVRSEDELAGVIAHELGHATVRHGAIDMSRYFKEILGVTQVSDRRDIFNKYNEFIEKWRTKKISSRSNHEDNQQLEADKVGIHALIAAGYDANLYTAFWSRFTDARRPNFFTKLFGGTRPADKRLREMVDAVKALPLQCFEKRTTATKEDFDKWRVAVINFTGLGGDESLKNLIYRRRLVPLRSDIEHLKFSPNGEYLLAQDDSTLTVLRRETLEPLFRVEAENALPAAFTPDSKTVVVYNKNLRVQKWNIAERSLISTHEVAVPGGFWQSYMSPDGNTLACYLVNGDLVLYDVATNEELFKQKEFYIPSNGDYYYWFVVLEIQNFYETPVLSMKFSPDGRYFLAGRKRITGGLIFENSFTMRAESEVSIAIDLQTRKNFSIGGNVKKLLYASFDFIGSDKIIGQFGQNMEKSGVFKFPTGERLDQFEMSGTSFIKAERGDYVLVRPVVGAAVGVYDLKQKKYVLANRKSALDVFDNFYVAERKNGELAIYKIGETEPIKAFELPPSPFGGLRTAALSADGNWLAVSEKSRGAVWNLQTGARVMHIRSFRGSYFAPDGMLYADFPKEGETARTIAAMDIKNNSVNAGNPITERNLRQHGKYVVVMKPLRERTEKSTKENDRPAYREEERERQIGFTETKMDVRDAQTGATLWTRQFDDETPAYFLSPTQNTLTLVWSLKSKAAKSIIKANPALSERLAQMQEKDGDYFLQILEPESGAIKGQFLLETGEGSFRMQSATAAGDYLLVGDDENRILIYSISQNRLLQRFFGSRAAISSAAGLIVVENVPGRLDLYDITSGERRGQLSFIKPVAIAQFTADGKRLFVLSADQTAFMFDAAKFVLQKANADD